MSAEVLHADTQEETRFESQVLANIYRDLHRLASIRLSKERIAGEWCPGSLVNETYLRIAKAYGKQWAYMAGHIGLWNKVMANVLVDYARAASAQKRQWGRRELLDDIAVPGRRENFEARIALRSALREAVGDNCRARTALRLSIQGMTVDEIASVLKVHPRTVKRTLRQAREALRGQLALPRKASAQSATDI